MSDNCVNETDLYFIEDFTDPLNLAKLKRRRKMVTIYRNTKNPKRLNQYKKNCFLRDQLLKALNLEAIKQITTWGNMNYDRRLKKLGLIPPSDPEIFKTEYVSERSIRFLNVFDNFELVECARYKVGSESSGVSSIHGSEETVCRLSPIAPIETEEEKRELIKLKESTTFDNLYNVIPEYNKKYTNINGKIWKKLVTIIENYSPTGRPEIPSGTYYGQVNENNKANGYGELVWGDAVIGGRADDTVKERGEMIGNWKNGSPLSYYIINRKYNSLIISMKIRDVDDNNKVIYELTFSTDFGTPINKRNLNVDNIISVFRYELIIVDKVKYIKNTFKRTYPVFKHSSYEGAPTAYLEEYAAKIALFVNLIDNEVSPVLIQLFLLENFNFDDILKYIGFMATQYNLDNLKDKFKQKYVKHAISRYINIPDNQYIKRINEVKILGNLIPNPDPKQLEEYYEQLSDEIKDGKSSSFQNIWDSIPQEYYNPLLEYKVRGEKPPLIYLAFNSSVDYHKPTILYFFLKNGGKSFITYNNNRREFNNPIIYYFISNNYTGESEQLNQKIRDSIWTLFRFIENKTEYIEQTNLINDLISNNINKTIVDGVRYISGTL